MHQHPIDGLRRTPEHSRDTLLPRASGTSFFAGDFLRPQPVKGSLSLTRAQNL